MSPLVLFVVVSLVTTALAHPNHQVNQRKKTMPQKKPMKMPPQMPSLTSVKDSLYVLVVVSSPIQSVLLDPC
ncbi:hypothetical protein MAR_028824 [Mya arenaria]|uniref:Agouti signaling protein n=1 Tax=Mya arenaria TaxID=6604 RepID=A0ABY7DEN9_MYAAR|nr:hypothetical protein MAR_028824 [Mya arenaria]